VTDPDSFSRSLLTRRPGAEVSIDLRRGDESLSVSVTLGERQDA